MGKAEEVGVEKKIASAHRQNPHSRPKFNVPSGVRF
jgi:hypothetical protein